MTSDSSDSSFVDSVATSETDSDFESLKGKRSFYFVWRTDVLLVHVEHLLSSCFTRIVEPLINVGIEKGGNKIGVSNSEHLEHHLLINRR